MAKRSTATARASEAAPASGAQAERVVVVTPPRMGLVALRLIGTTPYVQNQFGPSSIKEMRDKQVEGDVSKVRQAAKRKPKEFEKLYRESMHVTPEGWYGVPCMALRNGLIDVCRLVDFKMNYGKLSLFIEADGYSTQGKPLVKIIKGKPEFYETVVWLTNGRPDIKARGMWKPGWEVRVRIQFDCDQFEATDVVNLMARLGAQAGIGAGRAYSKNSGGCGWGHFKIAEGSQG